MTSRVIGMVTID